MSGYHLTSVHGDVEEFGDEIACVAWSSGQEETAPVCMCQEPHVDEDLVTEHVDIQLVGHVPDQFHEQLTFVHEVELLATETCGERPGEQT